MSAAPVPHGHVSCYPYALRPPRWLARFFPRPKRRHPPHLKQPHLRLCHASRLNGAAEGVVTVTKVAVRGTLKAKQPAKYGLTSPFGRPGQAEGLSEERRIRNNCWIRSISLRIVSGYVNC